MEEKQQPIEPSPKTISSEVVVTPEKSASEAKEDSAAHTPKKLEEEALDDGRLFSPLLTPRGNLPLLPVMPPILSNA